MRLERQEYRRTVIPQNRALATMEELRVAILERYEKRDGAEISLRDIDTALVKAGLHTFPRRTQFVLFSMLKLPYVRRADGYWFIGLAEKECVDGQNEAVHDQVG